MRTTMNNFSMSLLALACVLALLTACGGGSSSKAKDTTAPTAVISQSSGLISSTQAITVTFSEEMLTTSLVLGGSMATQSSTAWSSDNLTVTISPVSKWTEGTAKTLTVDATDLAGNAVAQITASFTIDSTAPTALSTTPASGSTIITAQNVVVVFSEAMSATVTLGGTIGTAAGAWSTTTVSNDTLTISPSTEWTAGSGVTLTISGSDANGVALSQITLTYTVVASKYVASTGSGSTCSKAAPCATIQAGIDAATSGRVLVAQGTYSVAGKVAVMKADVSLYGGYKTADWSTRSAATYTTTLTNSDDTDATGASSNPVETVEFDGSTTPITSATILDGFTINASNANYSAAIFIHATSNSSSPTVQYCTLQGGSDTSGSKNFIVVHVMNTAEPIIQYNTIKGGTVNTGLSMGIYNMSTTTHATINNNTLYFANIAGATPGSWLLYEGGSGTNDFKAITNNTFSTSGITGVTINSNAWYMRDDGSNTGSLGVDVSVGVDGLTVGSLSSFGNQ